MSYPFAIIGNLYKSKSYPDYCNKMHSYCVKKYVFHNISSEYHRNKPETNSNIIHTYRVVMWFYHSLFTLNYWIKCHRWQDRKINYIMSESL